MWPMTPASIARIKTILLLGALGLLALVAYFRFTTSSGTLTSAVIGKVMRAEEPAKVAAKVGRKRVAPPREIVTYDKPRLAAVLKMPEINLEPGNPVAVAMIPSHPGPTTSVAILDNVTGETRILMRAESPPFFQWLKEWQATGRYLFVGDHTAEADLEHRPFRINARDGRMTVEPYLFGGVDFQRSDSAIGGRAGIGVQVKF